MTIVFLTSGVEQKTIRRLRKGQVEESVDVESILSEIWTKATDRCRRGKK